MQVLDAHCGFLSNFEVLQLLKEDVHEQDVLVRAFKAQHSNFKTPKKSNYNAYDKAVPYFDYSDQLSKIVPHNVRTLQVESLAYLRKRELPCTRQNAKQISDILQAIDKVKPRPEEYGSRGSYALTKTEKLVMINLIPTRLVDLTVIIDDLDVRFTQEAQEELLQIFIGYFGDDLLESAKAADVSVKMEPTVSPSLATQTLPQDEEEAEEDDYYANEGMPDEENDLVDEGMGDGGRDAEIREIDEVAD